MRTLIATFDSDNDYNQEKQIKKIAENCSGPADLLIVNDYDHLEECIGELASLDYSNLIVLHENNLKFDDFESAIKSEYKELFENIEVIPELFHRRLREAAPVQPINPLTQPGDGDTTYIIFPWNGPVEGSANLINSISQRMNSGAKGITYCPQNDKAFWCSKCGHISQRFANGSKLNDFTVVHFSACGPMFMKDLQSPYSTITIEVPEGIPVLIDQIKNELSQSPQISKGQYIQNQRIAVVPMKGVSFADHNISKQAYDIGLEIGKSLVDKELKLNQKNIKNCQEWLGNEQQSPSKNARYGQRKFLIDCISQIMMLDKLSSIGKEPITSDKWKQFRDRAHEQFGFGKSFQTAQENIDNLGGGLFLDIAKTVVDGVKTAVEKDKNKSGDKEGQGNKEQIIVTHPKWNDFAKLFGDDPNQFKALKSEDTHEDSIDLGQIEETATTGSTQAATSTGTP